MSLEPINATWEQWLAIVLLIVLCSLSAFFAGRAYEDSLWEECDCAECLRERNENVVQSGATKEQAKEK